MDSLITAAASDPLGCD